MCRIIFTPLQTHQQHVTPWCTAIILPPQIGLVSRTPDAIAAKVQKLLQKPEYAQAAAAAGQKTRSVCGPALTAWLLADFARGLPEVETDSLDSSVDESSVEVGAKKEHKGREKSKEKEDSDGGWWPHFNSNMIRNRSSGDLSRAAVAAQ